MKLISRVITEKYIYETKETQEKHRKLMVGEGYTDSGKKRYDVNQSLYNPKYVLYGEYSKEIK